MEPLAKRRRLSPPLDAGFTQSFDDEHAYYETPASELDEEDEDAGGPVYGPDEDFLQKRALLDHKLKSTFESIFEKYSKDFEGIGDEIDLYTGEILVSNGHLLQMENERDPGDIRRARSIPTSATEEDEEVMTSSAEDDDDEEEEGEEEEEEGEEEEEEDDDEDEDVFSDEDMIEDDMILRGFAQASQFIHRKPPPEQGPFETGFMGRSEGPRRKVVTPPNMQRGRLPSRSEILSQFGPQLGQEIAKYVSQQSVLGVDANVEPAWQVPPIASVKPATRPIIRSVVQPDVERSPSPDNSRSIWAPAGSRSKRARFTAEEDQVLLDFVANARRQGLDLSRHLTWRQLEAMYPRHNWKAWKRRHKNKFTYLSSAQVDESEVSTSEVSTSARWIPPQRNAGRDSRRDFVDSTSIHPSRPVATERPIRTRKPAQRDSTILSWSEAVATIESVDPDLHAGLMEDARRIKSDASFGLKHPVSSSQILGRNTLQQTNSHPGIKESARQTGRSNASNEFMEDELAPYNPGFQREAREARRAKRAACPHSDCRDFPSTLYRLGRYDGEELSPLCLHLLRVHHTTPFPCAEFNCDRKGEQGYFLPEDLVRHVRQAHPYSTALDRLRGRVASSFLDREFDFTHYLLSTEASRHYPPSAHSRGRDLISPERHVGRYVRSSTRPSSSNSAQDITSTPRGPAASKQAAASTSASSLHVKPSLVKAKDMQPRDPSEERLYDSDVQILDGDPFLSDRSPLLEETRYSCPHKNSTGCNEMFTTRTLASAHGRIHTSEKAQSKSTGSQEKTSTAQESMEEQSKVHERSAPGKPPGEHIAAFEPKHSLPSSIPNSSNSSSDWTSYNTSALTPKHGRHGTTRKQISDPLPRNTIDPSYEFSDEELGLTSLVKEGPQTSKVISRDPPRPVSNPMPPLGSLTNSPPRPIRRPPFVTPANKAKSRKSVIPNFEDSEDFDELSLGTDGFLLMSSRPRSGFRSKPEAQTPLKREGTEVPGVSAQSSRKRKFSTLEGGNEIDELGTGISTSSPAQPTQIPIREPQIKTEADEVLGTNSSSTRSQKANTKNHNKRRSQPKSFQPPPTPVRSERQSSGKNTPLINLVGNRGSSDTGAAKSGVDVSIPSTSDLGSSPTARQTQTRDRGAVETSSLAGLLTPVRRKSQSKTSIKQEEEDGVVKTPGGTLRRCGEDGFACGRSFCFTCSTVAGS